MVVLSRMLVANRRIVLMRGGAERPRRFGDVMGMQGTRRIADARHERPGNQQNREYKGDDSSRHDLLSISCSSHGPEPARPSATRLLNATSVAGGTVKVKNEVSIE